MVSAALAACRCRPKAEINAIAGQYRTLLNDAIAALRAFDWSSMQELLGFENHPGLTLTVVVGARGRSWGPRTFLTDSALNVLRWFHPCR